MCAAPGLKAKPRILLVDDHAVVRTGLAQVLVPTFEVVGEAGDGPEALEQVRELKPDVVLMDFTMPRMNGAEAARAIREAAPEIKIVFLSMHESATIEKVARQSGADVYLSKGCSAHDLVRTLTGLL